MKGEGEGKGDETRERGLHIDLKIKLCICKILYIYLNDGARRNEYEGTGQAEPFRKRGKIRLGRRWWDEDVENER